MPVKTRGAPRALLRHLRSNENINSRIYGFSCECDPWHSEVQQRSRGKTNVSVCFIVSSSSSISSPNLKSCPVFCWRLPSLWYKNALPFGRQHQALTLNPEQVKETGIDLMTMRVINTDTYGSCQQRDKHLQFAPTEREAYLFCWMHAPTFTSKEQTPSQIPSIRSPIFITHVWMPRAPGMNVSEPHAIE